MAVAGSPFTADIIVRTIRLVIDGAISLRAASRACTILDQCNGGHGLDAPSQSTIQNHLLRLGLYLIQRTDQRREDWIWLLDHTINGGSTKCLIVLAISLQDFQKLTRPMTHHDLTVIGVMPVETSNGEVVDGQLEQLSGQFGTPLATLSDRGSDLKKGVQLFQKRHPGVASYYDIVHLVSRLIKQLFESNPFWAEYRKSCCRCANFLRQSTLAHLKPPKPKTKARYMNFDREVRWAVRAISVLDRVRSNRLNDRQRKRLDPSTVEKRLGWLDEYREASSMWMEVILTGQAINALVRRTGYQSATAQQIRQLGERLDHAQSRQLVAQVAAEVEAMCDHLPVGQSMPGSTEVLESLIGKGKRLLHHRGNSVTRQILSLAAATTEVTTDLVQRALSSCRMKHLVQWTRDTLGPGIHVERREDLSLSQEETKLRNLVAPATPNF